MAYVTSAGRRLGVSIGSAHCQVKENESNSTQSDADEGEAATPEDEKIPTKRHEDLPTWMECALVF